MRLSIALLLVFVVLHGCATISIRDSTVYRNEVKFLESAAIQEADAMEAVMFLDGCKCIGDDELYWEDKKCEKAATLIQTVRSRVPYHVQMMLFLGGLVEVRPPPKPPKILPATDLCPG